MRAFRFLSDFLRALTCWRAHFLPGRLLIAACHPHLVSKGRLRFVFFSFSCTPNLFYAPHRQILAEARQRGSQQCVEERKTLPSAIRRSSLKVKVWSPLIALQSR